MQVNLSKPSWVTHSSEPINAVDVHPDGSLFATGGGDTKVKLWSMQPCLDAVAEADGSIPRLLATLTGHLGEVTCVRWSRDGRFLASSSDDNCVMVWRRSLAGERPAAAAFGDSAEPNVESWRSIQTLRGHSSDVVGVAWAPDSRRLASASLDNTVRVWDVMADAGKWERAGTPAARRRAAAPPRRRAPHERAPARTRMHGR